MDAKTAKAKGLVACEDKDGNVEFLTPLALQIRNKRKEPTAWPLGKGAGSKKDVVSHAHDNADDDGEGKKNDHAEVATAASVIEALKATTTEAEARAVIGDDERKTVQGALVAHLRKLAGK